MAELYLARAIGIEGFERYVVVKRIMPEYARDHRFVNMFLDEARLSAQLHHPNIAQVYDIGQERRLLLLHDGVRARRERARRSCTASPTLKRRMPLEHALAIVIAGAAAGLHYAHEKRGTDRRAARHRAPRRVAVERHGQPTTAR